MKDRRFLQGIGMLIIVFSFLIIAWNNPNHTPGTFDIIIDTDLGGDPDDIQSLFRAVHYSDILKIKGIIATPCNNMKYHPWDTISRVKLIKDWIRRIDVNHLRKNGYENLMNEKSLLKVVKLGAELPGAPGEGKSTEGSEWIIDIAKKHSINNPVWILVWGRISTVAQALYDAPEIANKIRINFIGAANTRSDISSRDFVFDFMVSKYNDLWWIEDGVQPRGSHDTFKGTFQSGNQKGEWSNSNFIGLNIRGHGSDHKGMFDEKCGDIFPEANFPRKTLKEGDSPTMLFLLSPVIAGIGNVDDATEESWGGQFRHFDQSKYPNYYIDLSKHPKECQYTIGKWRKDFLEDWKERWDRY